MVDLRNKDDVEQFLMDRLKHHENESRKIRAALASYRNQEPQTQHQLNQIQKRQTKQRGSRKAKWANNIDMLFENTDEWLSTDEVRGKLFEMGMQEATEQKNRQLVYNTLLRRAKNGILERNSDGKYRSKRKHHDTNIGTSGSRVIRMLDEHGQE